MTMQRHEDARRIRAALSDPFRLCDQLGLIPETGRGRVWFHDSAHALRIPCPWHTEKTGSCNVSQGPDGTVRVRCFGCGATGDALSLVAVAHRLDVTRNFGQVLDAAADLAEVPRPAARHVSRSAASDASPARAAPVRAPETPDDGIMERIAQVLRERAPVTRSPVAMQYLRDRCIAHGAALGWFALPGAARGLDALRVAVVDAIGLDAWVASGLAHGDRGEEWRRVWRGRLVIPWEAPDGTVQTLQGRPLREPREGERKYTVPLGRPVRWPWGVAHLGELAGPDTAVAVVEGAVDALSWNALAAEHDDDSIAVATPGVDAWRDAWATVARGRVAVVALDVGAPPARVEAVRASMLREALSVETRTPPVGKDWNDTLRALRAQKETA